MPVFLLFSLFLLVRGHNEPGGGFTGGLVAASGLCLYGLAYGPNAVRQAVRMDLRKLIGVGLAIALFAALIAVVQGRPFFAGVWVELNLGLRQPVKLGTPLLFDIGVYLVVVSMTLTIVMAHLDELEERP